MFIDEKIKDEIKIYKEQKKYLSTYNTDLVHQELKEDFNKVLDNIESLANTFEFNMGIEIITLSAILLHGGYLSVTSKYIYKNGLFDIKEFFDDKTLFIALKIFTGFGCCRHTASFIKQVLDRFNIKNNMVLVDVNELDYNINDIRLFLSSINKKISSNPNHVINYISENDYNYFFDLTSNHLDIFKAFNQFATSVYCDNLSLPLYSYNYSLYNDEFIDYSKVPPLTEYQENYLKDKANDTIDICNSNRDLLMHFYLQNIGNYQRINANYNKVYEKEKSLGLIKK